MPPAGAAPPIPHAPLPAGKEEEIRGGSESIGENAVQSDAGASPDAAVRRITYRRRLYRIKAGIAPILFAERPALAMCGRYGQVHHRLALRDGCLCHDTDDPRNGTVDLVRSPREVVRRDGEVRREWRARVAHVATCKNPHLCPTCSNYLRGIRAAEVNQAIVAHGVERTLMLTLTTAHYADDDLRWLLLRWRDACRSMQERADWKHAKRDFGIFGQIRASDITHGYANGWHYHQHRVLFLEEPLSDDRIALLETLLSTAWALAVQEKFGRKYRPDEHGVKLTRTPPGQYLCKLGLELIDLGTKSPKNFGGETRRTFFQIAEDATDGDVPSAALVREFAAAMYCEKHIHWTKGLAEMLGVGAKEEPAAAVEGESSETPENDDKEHVVMTLPREYVERVWSVSYGKRTPFGVPFVSAVLEAIEAHDDAADARAAAQAVLDQVEHYGVPAPQANLEAAEAQLAVWGRFVESAARRRLNAHRQTCKNPECKRCRREHERQCAEKMFRVLRSSDAVVAGSLDDVLRRRAERARAGP